MPARSMEEHVLLGHTWYYLTNCQIDWHSCQAKILYKEQACQVPLLPKELPVLCTMQNNSDITFAKGKGKAMLPNDSPWTLTSKNAAITLTTLPKTPQ